MADVWDIAESLSKRGGKADVWDLAEAAVPKAETQGNYDASPAETERMKQKFLQESGGTVERLKQNAKAWGKAVVPYIRPAVEGLGAAGGAIIGTGGGLLGLNPVTATLGGVAGAGLGYAGAKNIMDTIEGDWAQTPTESFTRAAKDIGTGAMFEMGSGLLPPVVGGISRGISAVAKPTLGKMSGTGLNAINEAVKSGEKSFKGNPFKSSTEFDKALRGETTADDIVSNVKGALDQVKMKRAADYQSKLAVVDANKQPIDMTPFKMDLSDLMDTYKVKINNGKIDTSRVPMGAKGRRDIEDVIDTISSWGSQQGDDTAIGLDTLKRQLDDFYSDSSQARQFVTEIKNKVKDAIVKHVPEYGEMTKNYSETTRLIKDLESGLMLRKNGMTGRITENQTLNRLNSAMKDNNELRKDLLEVLGTKTNEDLLGQVAGFSMNPMLPRGLAGVTATTAAASLNPSYLAAFAASSPRAQGEFLRLLGKVKGAEKTINPLTKQGINRQAAISFYDAQKENKNGLMSGGY